MIFIDNLCEFVKISLEKRLAGVYCPQDDKTVTVFEIVKIVSKLKNKKIYFSRILGYY